MTCQIRPECTEMDFKLIETESPHGIKQGIQVVLEPVPDLTGGHAMGRSRVGAHGLDNGRESGELANGEDRLSIHVVVLGSERMSWLDVAENRLMGRMSANGGLGGVGTRALCLGLGKQSCCGGGLITEIIWIDYSLEFIGKKERIALGSVSRVIAFRVIVIVISICGALVVCSVGGIGLLVCKASGIDGRLTCRIVGLLDVVLKKLCLCSGCWPDAAI